MKWFYSSIIAVVLGAIFLIGWGFDRLVDDETPQHSVEMQLHRQTLEGMAAQLNRHSPEELAEATVVLSQDYQQTLSVVESHSIALPPSLSADLDAKGGLSLVSEQGSYLLKRLERHPHFLLQLKLPSSVEQGHYNVDLALTVMLYLGVSFIIILWTLPLTRRLHLLNAVSAKFGEGDLSARIPTARFSYIRLLETSFNAMADRIETLLMDNKVLARSLSHDIRTPVACLRFGIEAAMSTDDIAKKNNYISRMDSEVTRMEAMTDAFLEYAGMERQLGSVRLQSVDLVQWLATSCGDLEDLASQFNIQLRFETRLSTQVCDIDGQWFYRALQNLISNGIDYAQSQVCCKLSIEEQYVVIDVEDDGEGIADEQCAAIFDPFIRLDSDRSREAGHFGLGLAITTKIMDWHHGQASADNASSLGGARLRLKLPLKG